MKKIALLICSLFIITGCSEKEVTKVVCTKSGGGNTVTLTGDIKDKKLSGPIKAELYFEDPFEAQDVCIAEEEFVSTLDEDTKYNVTCSSNEVIIDDYTFVLTNQGIDVEGMTKTQFKKAMEGYSFSCQ